MKCMFKHQRQIYRHDFQRYFQNKNYFTKDDIKQKFQNKVKNENINLYHYNLILRLFLLLATLKECPML